MAREVRKTVKKRQQKGASHRFEPFSAEAQSSLSRPSGPGDPVEEQMERRRCREVRGLGGHQMISLPPGTQGLRWE